MNDADVEFARAFERGEVPNVGFHHRDHIRLAWIYVQLYGDAAAERISESIRGFAAKHGQSEKYHQTVTTAWICLVEDACRSGGEFDEIVACFPALLDKNFLKNFYSEDTLASPDAKKRFVSSDLRPLAIEAHP